MALACCRIHYPAAPVQRCHGMTQFIWIGLDLGHDGENLKESWGEIGGSSMLMKWWAVQTMSWAGVWLKIIKQFLRELKMVQLPVT